MKSKRIVFLTGTRADFGKIKPLIESLENEDLFEVVVVVTGMHLLHQYGYTLIEIERCNFSKILTFENDTSESTMDLTLAKTIKGFSTCIKTVQPDLIVVHGDRVEALAGAIVGSLNNILVAHIEGGEVSGTIDELIRHSVSKLSHLHFVSNEEAKRRLIQMGEVEKSVHVIGSPDIDVMLSKTLPILKQVKEYYEIKYDSYAIAMFHPVTTEFDEMGKFANEFVQFLLEDQNNYIVIFPNNDLGSKEIITAYEKFRGNERFKIYPSLRFEYFLTLLKNADYIIGNSSAGIREAPYYGIPTINIGSRQQNRALDSSIINVDCDKHSIHLGIKKLKGLNRNSKDNSFGTGNSAQLFLNCLKKLEIWEVSNQKVFQDIT